MAISEQFALRWNDFHSNLSQSFHALLEGEDLVDVTIAAGGQYVHAHKLILSVCSPYFKELFKMNPCEHPIVILKDVAYQELKLLLQFMYCGEVKVRQQELPGFLHTAELLQVKGLTSGQERSESPPVPEEPLVTPILPPQNDSSSSQGEWVPGGDDTMVTETIAEPTTIIKEEAARSPLKRLLKNTPNKNNYNVKKKPRPVNDSPTHAENTEYVSDSEPLIDFDSDLFQSVLVTHESAKESGWNCKTGGVKCPSCHRFFANRYNLKVHIRDKHDTREGTLQCELCQKRMRNPSCLRVHMYHHRKQAAYLAQLSSQGDQMSRIYIKRSNALRSHDPTRGRNIIHLDRAMGARWIVWTQLFIICTLTAELRVPNMVGGKWNNDTGLMADFRDVDESPSTPAPETKLADVSETTITKTEA